MPLPYLIRLLGLRRGSQVQRRFQLHLSHEQRFPVCGSGSSPSTPSCCPTQNPEGLQGRPGHPQPPLLSCRATVKPVLVLLPVLGLTWLVSMLVHLSPAWAYAAVGLNSFQVPPGPGPSGTRAVTCSGAQRE